jgi:hypothetical protein
VNPSLEPLILKNIKTSEIGHKKGFKMDFRKCLSAFIKCNFPEFSDKTAIISQG